MSATARANAVPAKQSALDRELEERLVRYVRIDTQSDERSTTSPSTDTQYDLLRLLVEELRAIGAEDVRLADYGAVLATIRRPRSALSPRSHCWRTSTRHRRSPQRVSSRSCIAPTRRRHPAARCPGRGAVADAVSVPGHEGR
jgi:hypothetical protein